uniref:Protein FAM64A n=1 Tax=Macrostomum lignano TaxID=282301 RepID=A0A1I8F9D9_9PLAT
MLKEVTVTKGSRNQKSLVPVQECRSGLQANGEIIRVSEQDAIQLVAGPRPASGWVMPSWHFPGPNVSEKALKSDMAVDFESVTLQDSGHAPESPHPGGPPRAVGMSCRPPSSEARRTSSLSQSATQAACRRPEELRRLVFVRLASCVEQWESRGRQLRHPQSRAVKRVMDSGRVCVLALRPTAWRPCGAPAASHALTVFVLPPQHHSSCGTSLGQLEDIRGTNHYLSSAVQQLVEQLEKLSTQRQWVPSAWLEDSTR